MIISYSETHNYCLIDIFEVIFQRKIQNIL
jgi:hypothetical protein